MKKKARLIAFYLPQYHPIPENDAFWGKGFTEWTNVTKAKPLYKGHEQPKLPSDLGFYDLRVPQVRQAQADLAKAHGVEAFCYWHYWFGNGKRVLEKVFDDVLKSGKPDFPFCLAWANESWTGKWHGLDDKIIFEQSYPGKRDFEQHFYNVLPAFKDKRYMKVNDKPVFVVYRPKAIKPTALEFANFWNELAKKEGLNGIYFIGVTENWDPTKNGFDAMVSNAPFWNNSFMTLYNKILKKINIKRPNVYSYKKYVEFEKKRIYQKNELPVIVPNWDNTPRSGNKGNVLKGNTPELYKAWLNVCLNKIKTKEKEERILFIKSWNEWAEGNYLEPDRIFSNDLLKVTKEEIIK